MIGCFRRFRQSRSLLTAIASQGPRIPVNRECHLLSDIQSEAYGG